jgi:centractin
MAGGIEGDIFVGNKAQELRGLLKLRYPIEHGIITNWIDIEQLWNYIYSDELKVSPEAVRNS